MTPWGGGGLGGLGGCWGRSAVGAEVGAERVVLNGLVQHQRQQPGPVGHRRPHVALLLKQLVQLVPLRGMGGGGDRDNAQTSRTP